MTRRRERPTVGALAEVEHGLPAPGRRFGWEVVVWPVGDRFAAGSRLAFEAATAAADRLGAEVYRVRRSPEVQTLEQATARALELHAFEVATSRIARPKYTGPPQGKSVRVTVEQREVFERALERIRHLTARPDLSEGTVLEYLAAEFLSGVN